MRLTLTGAALNALRLSLVTGVVLIRQDSLEILRFWVAGSLSQATVSLYLHRTQPAPRGNCVRGPVLLSILLGATYSAAISIGQVDMARMTS